MLYKRNSFYNLNKCNNEKWLLFIKIRTVKYSKSGIAINLNFGNRKLMYRIKTHYFIF